jgi:hypothetical protein
VQADQIFVMLLVLLCVAAIVGINWHSKRSQASPGIDTETPSNPSPAQKQDAPVRTSAD